MLLFWFNHYLFKTGKGMIVEVKFKKFASAAKLLRIVAHADRLAIIELLKQQKGKRVLVLTHHNADIDSAASAITLLV